jgi:hypothetical protein
MPDQDTITVDVSAIQPKDSDVIRIDPRFIRPSGGKQYKEPWIVKQLPTAGAIAGSVLGGGIPGAAAGGMAGAALEEGIRSIKEDRFVPPKEAGKKILESGLEGAATEVGGRVAAKGLGKLSRMTPWYKAAQESVTKDIVQLNKEVPGGLGLTASELADRPRRIGQYLASYSFFGKTGMDKERKTAATRIESKVNEWIADFVKQSTTNPREAGTITRDALSSADKVFNREAKTLYKTVDQEAGGVTVNLDPFKKAVATQEAKASGLKKVGGGAVSAPESDVAKLFSTGKKINPDITFSEAQDLRSELTDRLRDDKLSPKGRRMYAIALENLNQSMEAAAQKKPGLWKAYREANDFYRHGKETFENEAITYLLKKDPEKLVGAVGPGSVTRAESIRKALTQYSKYASPDEREAMEKGFDSFREQWIRNRLFKAPEEGQAMDLFRLKKRMEVMGKGTLDVLFDFDPKGRVLLKNLNTLSAAMSRLTPLTAHGHAQIIKALSIATTAASGHLTGAAWEAVTTEGVPFFISKILYSPKLTRMLVEGLDDAALSKNRFMNIGNLIRTFRMAASGILDDDSPVKVKGEKQPQIPVPPGR